MKLMKVGDKGVSKEMCGYISTGELTALCSHNPGTGTCTQ